MPGSVSKVIFAIPKIHHPKPLSYDRSLKLPDSVQKSLHVTPPSKPKGIALLQEANIRVQSAIVGGSIRIVFGLPWETVKDNCQKTGSPFIATLTSQVKADGFKSLYAGTLAFGAMATCNVLFKNATIDYTSKWLAENGVKSTTAQLVGAAIFTGASETYVLQYIQVPDAVQLRATAHKTTDTISIARQMYTHGGVKEFYRGASLTAIRQSAWITGYLLLLQEGKDRGLTGTKLAVYGIFAGGVASFLSCPTDVIRTQMLCHTIGSPKVTMTQAFNMVITSEGGIKNFWRGMPAKFTALGILGTLRPINEMAMARIRDFYQGESNA